MQLWVEKMSDARNVKSKNGKERKMQEKKNLVNVNEKEKYVKRKKHAGVNAK
jgi:hypothetical protein